MKYEQAVEICEKYNNLLKNKKDENYFLYKKSLLPYERKVLEKAIKVVIASLLTQIPIDWKKIRSCMSAYDSIPLFVDDEYATTIDELGKIKSVKTDKFKILQSAVNELQIQSKNINKYIERFGLTKGFSLLVREVYQD